MEQRLSLITLGVTDLPRARAFYEQLGWTGQETQETVFLDGGGVTIVLWGRDELAADSGVPTTAAGEFGGIVLAHNVRAEAEVDEIIAVAQAAGATITRPPGATFYGGYAACFMDPDGHIWEIAYNPGFTFRDDGTIVIPDFGP